ncbi:MAG: glycosyltransferase family 4 protein [Chloroflexi bacterium]|jgi:glycosyltransferase involved in cell wall biosynthesis|nr:glycosyltransferase family 4 protein [Chloroflexota bacterium]
MSMRIALCTGQIPFANGGAEILTESLAAQLRQRGHQVEIVRIPFRWFPKEEILKGYLAWRLINLEESESQRIDRIIALKFPGFVASHPNKVTWLIQQFRQAYDLFGTEHSYLTNSPEDAELLRSIKRIDQQTIGESRHIYTISGNVGKRLRRYNGLSSQVLYPPPAMDGRFYHRSYGDYVLSLCRLNRLKRVDRLIEAMTHTNTPVRCLIAGQGEEREALQKLAERKRVADRVEFLGRVSDEEALELYANALAVYYAPLDEDYGLATVEAMKSQKPVLTADDSGGVLEFVRDGVTGYVLASDDAPGMARRIDELYEDRHLAEQLGMAASQQVAAITWDAVIEKLLLP